MTTRRPHWGADLRRRHVEFAVILSSLLVAPVRADVVRAIAMTVSDADRARDFFTTVLDFEPASDRELAGTATEHLLGIKGARVRIVGMQLGDETIELMQFTDSAGRAMPPDSQANDRWFQHVAIITSDMDAAFARLQNHGVRPASVSPQTLPGWNRQAAGIRAYYFRDPDGHFLEILQFPPEKGDAKWHAATDRLFLGIDHTAIVVADTKASLAFYHDRVGLRIAGESENYGAEQERLNNVAGARLRITTLRATAGPGVELLEYLAPRDGRPMPDDTRPNDLWHWHVQLDRSPVERAEFSSGSLIRDPDGHALLLNTSN